MLISLISDTHNKHKQLELPGGDLILCAGDISSRGYFHEIRNFCKWFEAVYYDNCVFIAGNHDFGFQDDPEECMRLLSEYPGIDYLQDDLLLVGNEWDAYEEKVKIYGSPWQPWFYNWAFNLPRNGWEIEQKWKDIPANTDILVTHGPPFGILDRTPRGEHVGCEFLLDRIKEIKPKIHVFGHIHCEYGYYFDGTTHYFNASVLNEQYEYQNTPFSFNWDKGTNRIEFL